MQDVGRYNDGNDWHISFHEAFVVTPEPDDPHFLAIYPTIYRACKHFRSARWQVSMKTEFAVLRGNDTVPLSGVPL